MKSKERRSCGIRIWSENILFKDHKKIETSKEWVTNLSPYGLIFESINPGYFMLFKYFFSWLPSVVNHTLAEIHSYAISFVVHLYWAFLPSYLLLKSTDGFSNTCISTGKAKHIEIKHGCPTDDTVNRFYLYND